MSSNRSRMHKEFLRKEAEERQAEYDKLSLKDKLDRLPKDGAKKQRARLEGLLSKNNTPVEENSNVE